ncbi:hypothetical protein [Natrialba aegyptia]|nr:hypothetical protein [Natrialba aegyptia]
MNGTQNETMNTNRTTTTTTTMTTATTEHVTARFAQPMETANR